MRLHPFTQHGNIVRDVEFLIPKHMDRQTANWRNEKNHRSTAVWSSTLFNLYCFEALEHVFLHTSCIHHCWKSQLCSWTLWVPSPGSGQLFTKHTGDIWSWWKSKKKWVSMPVVCLLVKARSEVSDHLFLVSLLEHILQLRGKTRLKKGNDKTKVTEACTQWSWTVCWGLLLSIPVRSCDWHTLGFTVQ